MGDLSSVCTPPTGARREKHQGSIYKAPEHPADGAGVFQRSSLDSLRGAANENMPDIDADRASCTFLSWDLETGDCLVHHSVTARAANRSQMLRRRAICTCWLGDQSFYRRTASHQPDVVGL